MNRTQWGQPVTPGEAARRAGGRRAYNARRWLAAIVRRRAVFLAYDQGASIEDLAQQHGVSCRTIQRDLQRRRATYLSVQFF